jgi:hypothetical protein
MVIALRGTVTATATTLREEWQRWYFGRQKPRGLGERRMERIYASFSFDFFREYAGFLIFFT